MSKILLLNENTSESFLTLLQQVLDSESPVGISPSPGLISAENEDNCQIGWTTSFLSGKWFRTCLVFHEKLHVLKKWKRTFVQTIILLC